MSRKVSRLPILLEVDVARHAGLPLVGPEYS
jgi:hypothetical protein